MTLSLNFRFHFKIYCMSTLGENSALARGDRYPHGHTSTCLVGRGSLGVRIIDAPLPGSLQLAALFPCQAGRCAARSRAECLSPHIEFQRGSSRVSLREIRFKTRPLPLAALLRPITALLPSADPHFEWKFSPVELIRGAPRRVGGMERH